MTEDRIPDPTEVPRWDDLTTRGRIRVLLSAPYAWNVRMIAGYLDLSTQAVYDHRAAIAREQAEASA